jgi:hypothetical protein
MPAGATVSASGTIPAAASQVRRSWDPRPCGRGGGSRYVPQPEVIRNAAPASRGARHRSQGIAAVSALPVVVGGGAARGLRARWAGLPPRGRWRLGPVEGRPSRRPTDDPVRGRRLPRGCRRSATGSAADGSASSPIPSWERWRSACRWRSRSPDDRSGRRVLPDEHIRPLRS